MTRRGVHTKASRGITVDWCSPPDIVEPLGPFDLDPCCPYQMVNPTASVMITNDPRCRRVKHNPVTFGDGLGDWSELAGKPDPYTFMNPPYGIGNSRQWCRKMASHGNGIALIASRTEVDDWFVPYIWEAATAVLFLYGRLHYYSANGVRAKGNAGHGSVLAAYGPHATSRLVSANFRGKLVLLRSSMGTTA